MSTTTQADIDTMELETSEANENEENEDQNGEIEEVPTEEEKEPDEDDNNSNAEPPPDENKANVKKLFGAANKTAKKISLIGRVPKSCRTFNMELAKALGILGFTNTRWNHSKASFRPGSLFKNHADQQAKSKFSHLNFRAKIFQNCT